LVLVNLVFAAAGILFIYYPLNNNSGWRDAFKDDVPGSQAIFAGAILLGCTLISVSGLGLYGVLRNTTKVLCCYSAHVGLAVVLAVTLMAGSFVSMNFAEELSGSSYPGAEQEPAIANAFNQAYCTAEGAYLCTSVNVRDLVESANGQVPDFVLSQLEGFEGVDDLCNTAKGKVVLSTLPDSSLMKTVCDECNKANQYKQYEGAFAWVDEQCPLTEVGADALSWCAAYLFEGKEGATYDGAPYEACRPKVLEVWIATSKNMGIGMSVSLVILLIVMVSSCMVLRRKRNADGSEDQEKPPAEGTEVVLGNQSDEEQQGGGHHSVTVY